MVATEPSKPRRIELILRQIDSLPTLPVIATRLLSLTANDDARAQDVIDLVSADPPLTAKVLSLCRAADRGVQESAVTIERAVLLLGFNAIRNAVLSVKVFEMFGSHVSAFEAQGPKRTPAVVGEPGRGGAQMESRASQDDDARFDRVAFWSHSLAVAILAEQIAKAHRDPELPADEAFVCGLLHDVGKLALDHVLPRAFARIVELADLNQGNIAEFERKLVGIDHHTAGKRLAEQWQLPHRLQDSIWLHGTAYESLPDIEHHRLVGLIALADLLARRQHVGYSGNHNYNQNPDRLIERLGLHRERVHGAVAQLHEQLEVRGRALGLHEQPSQELFLQSMQRANQALGHANQVLEVRTRTVTTQRRVLEAITDFHAQAAPGSSVQDALDAVAASARRVFGEGFYAMLYPGDPKTGTDNSWLVAQYAPRGQARWQYLDPPPNAPDLAQLNSDEPLGMNLMGILPWIADYLLDAEDLRQVKLLPLPCGWGTSAVLLHDRRDLPAPKQIAALTSTWGAAIAAAAQHDGARRMGEALAETNSQLAEAQDRLLQQESLARLGRMAAGAAHEMNNPLAVISGRSQLLAMSLQPGSKEQRTAQTVFEEAHRLSDLITTLHTFADPPEPVRYPAELPAVLDEAIKRAHAGRERTGHARAEITYRLRHKLPRISMDPDQVREAITALLENAQQARPVTTIEVVVQLTPDEDAVVIQVRDDGAGMDETTLNHALDPFFSDRPAGRGLGMGLPRAKRIVEAHGGSLELRSTPGEGTTAIATLPLKDPAKQPARDVEM
ncbi:MAG: HDOD domain-containing protein [Phycisphaeraceae bacterium]